MMVKRELDCRLGSCELTGLQFERHRPKFRFHAVNVGWLADDGAGKDDKLW